MANITMKASDVRMSAQFALTDLMERKAAWLNVEIKKLDCPFDDEIDALRVALDMAKFIGDDATMQVNSAEFNVLQHNLPAKD